ncbi:MerR family transcriptional regulator [Streptomyces sp. 1222.5]|uniref:MerR family transcriptional regulator n=1 Tax=Streptomyces sp. 1222.5 TaxID=1881026 RepID=UPI003EB7AF85
MNGPTLYSIGELARRTGLTVKAIRFYSDRGIVPPADRTPAGYRRYGQDAVARLAFVRTLRDLGLGLDAVRRVVDQELTLGQVATEHAAALDVQITGLRLWRAVLTAAAATGEPTIEGMERMHRLATLSEAERHRLVDDFLGAVFDGAPPHPGSTGIRRSLTPELPDRPTEEQVAAWVELAEMSTDPVFRSGLRRLLDELAAGQGGGTAGPPRPDVVALARDAVAPALASGVDPASPRADPVVAALTSRCAAAVGRPDDARLPAWLLHRLRAASDPRRDRYVHLLAVVNGWPAPQPLGPVVDWAVEALSVRTAR